MDVLVRLSTSCLTAPSQGATGYEGGGATGRQCQSRLKADAIAPTEAFAENWHRSC